MLEELKSALVAWCLALNAKLYSTKAATSDDVKFLGGLSYFEVKALVTPADIGLGLLANNPMATTAEAQAGTAANRYMSPKRVSDSAAVRLAQMSGAAGTLPYGNGSGGFKCTHLLSLLNVVVNQVELDAALAGVSKLPIVDARNMNTYTWDTTTMQWVTGVSANYVAIGRFYHNQVTGKLFYAEFSDRLLHVMG